VRSYVSTIARSSSSSSSGISSLLHQAPLLLLLLQTKLLQLNPAVATAIAAAAVKPAAEKTTVSLFGGYDTNQTKYPHSYFSGLWQSSSK
jgi:hypothetical protein